MALEFRLAQHSIRRVQIVEVWQGGVMLATITPADLSETAPGTSQVRVFSKYLERATWLRDPGGVGVAIVTFGRMQ